MWPALDVMIPFQSLGKSGVVFLHGGLADLAGLHRKVLCSILARSRLKPCSHGTKADIL